MKLATCRIEKSEFVCILLDRYAVVLKKAHFFFFGNPSGIPDGMKSLIGNPSFYENAEKIKKDILKCLKNKTRLNGLKKSGIIRDAKDIDYLPPITNPNKIICIGANYLDHIKEFGAKIPTNPILFAKYSTALTGHGQNIVHPEITEQMDYEAELAVIIGKKGKKISTQKALDYVFGYTNFNDVTARDIQSGDGQWVRGKTIDTFAPIGPWIVTRDEIKNPNNLSIKSVLNGKIMQDSNTQNLIFNVQYLISFISMGITLEPGDIIATGTPAGVGMGKKPPRFLKPGDKISVEIEKIGRLTNTVK